MARLVAAEDVQEEAPKGAKLVPANDPGTLTQMASDPRQAAYEKMVKQGGWGTGVAPFMYEMGGKVTDATGLPSLGAAVNVLPDALQTMLGGNVAAAAAKPVTEAAAKSLMQSALKPTLDQVKRGRAAPAIETMLTDGKGGLFSYPGYNPTAGGVEKMKGTLGELSERVSQEIANSGAMIPTASVADYAARAYPRFSTGPNAVSALDDIGRVQQGFIDHPMVMGAREIPIQQAQEMKTGYQRAIGDKGYGDLKTPTTEAEKQVARGLRELIAEARPGVVEPLKRESEIINALKMAERRVAVDANKNPVGLGWIGNPLGLPFWLWDRSALAKATTARALQNGQFPALGGAMGGLLYRQSEE